MPFEKVTPKSDLLALAVNGGSSTIKYAVFSLADSPTRIFNGQVDRIGGDPHTNVQQIIDTLQKRLGSSSLAGIGHRIVHGGVHLFESRRITHEVLAELRKAQSLDLAHLPNEIALIEAFLSRFPGIPQIACFDTAFHHDMPTVARMLPIPRRYYDAGIQRLGFHGLSYTYLLSRLAEIAGLDAARGKLILAHLGSGSSMAAVDNGKPIDTTMSFTPTAGLMMGTRPGDMDPGLLLYLMQSEKLTPDQMDTFISQECGLVGVSDTTADMRDLLKSRATDPRAAEAIDLYCYQARKFIGALTTTLGGLDHLIFSGGIGEHSPEIRAAICQGLKFLGIEIDPQANAAGHDIISTAQSKVIIHVIPTDEEIIIAQAIAAILPRSPG